jgi:hypothetical protein
MWIQPCRVKEGRGKEQEGKDQLEIARRRVDDYRKECLLGEGTCIAVKADQE